MSPLTSFDAAYFGGVAFVLVAIWFWLVLTELNDLKKMVAAIRAERKEKS